MACATMPSTRERPLLIPTLETRPPCVHLQRRLHAATPSFEPQTRDMCQPHVPPVPPNQAPSGRTHRVCFDAVGCQSERGCSEPPAGRQRCQGGNRLPHGQPVARARGLLLMHDGVLGRERRRARRAGGVTGGRRRRGIVRRRSARGSGGCCARRVVIERIGRVDRRRTAARFGQRHSGEVGRVEDARGGSPRGVACDCLRH